MNIQTQYAKHLSALLMFGTNGIVASFIALTSYEIVLTRTLVAGLLLSGIFALSRKKALLFESRKNMLFMAASGVSMGASWMFLYEAYTQIGVGTATLVYYCGPVIVMVLSPLIFRERLTWPKIAGFLAVILGMLCINSQSVGGGGTAWGMFCGIMAAITYALMVISNKKVKGITGLENSMWQLIIAFVTVAAFVGLKQGLTISIEPKSVVPILILGLINTGIGCYFYFSSIGNLPVQTVAVCGYLEPLSAVIFSMLFLHEKMGLFEILGALLILGGAAFGELFGAGRKKSSAL